MKWRHILFVGLLAGAACRSAAAPHGDVRYIDDDYPRAVALSRSGKRPMLVEAWASWCTECRAMSAALADPSITSLRDRFVWLALDADRRDNASFFERYPAELLPSLWVIDGESGEIVFKLHSPLDPPAMRRLLVASAAVAHGDRWDRPSVDARWIAALEGAPPRTPNDRQVDGLVLPDVYRRVGTLERALPLYAQLELDYPKTYEIPLEHARLLLELAKPEEAQAAIERAQKVDAAGTSIGIPMTAADIAVLRGDHEAARKALREALARAERLPDRTDVSMLRTALKAKLALLSGEEPR